MEEAIHETLQTTKESVAQKMEQARNEAKTVMDRAHIEAERKIQEAQQQRSTIRQDIMRLLERRDEMIQGFQQFLENNMGMVEKFAANEFHIFDPIEESETPQVASKKPGLEETVSSLETNPSAELEDLPKEAEPSELVSNDLDIESDTKTPNKKKESTSSSLDDDDFMNTFLDELD